jgi:UDPglucose--hexose-1-phosphate uridylyltransferase
VVIETPDHNLTLPTMSDRQVEDVFWAFRERVIDLKKDQRLRYIMIFKNHGEAAGASLEHPHSQLIALPVIPKRAREELDGSKGYFDFKERCVYCDIIRQETKSAERVVAETDRYVVLQPYAARFPFETWIVPKRHGSHFENIDAPQLQNLAWVLRSTLRKMDKVLEKPAYNFMIHTAPVQDAPMAQYHWHIELIPKLTKVAGFEWGTGFYINPTPPEEAAQFLREAGLG